MPPYTLSAEAEAVIDAIESSTVRICASLSTLLSAITRQFEQHDTDLRVAVEQTTEQVQELIAILRPVGEAFAKQKESEING